MDYPTLPGVTGVKGSPLPKRFQGSLGLSSGEGRRAGALIKDLERCAVHSRMPLGVLCRAVQELHECLVSVVQSSDLLDLGMLDVAEKDPMVPTSEGRSPSPIPWEELPIGVTTPSKPHASEPGEATQPEGLALVPRQ